MKNIGIVALLTAVVFSSCEFESYEEYGIDPYDGDLTFVEENHKAEWKNRYDHAAVSFNGKLWILGGYNPGQVRGDTYYEDVWSSEDGISWTQEVEDAPWLGRRGHKVVVFNDGTGEALYLIGGFSVDERSGYRQYNNDVWKSSDGVNWTEIKSNSEEDLETPLSWHARSDHAVVVANHGGTDYIYLIGGRTQLEGKGGTYAQEYFDDVWRSTNGVDWTYMNNNDFGRRASHAATVDPATGTIYIQGGNHGIIFEAPNNAGEPVENFYHLWSSTDGVTWTSNYDSSVPSSYLSRKEHEMVFYDGKIWTFPGTTTSSMHYSTGNSNHYPLWVVDGATWYVDSEGSDIRGRHSYGAVVFDGKMWIMGGFTTNLGQNNDVWSAAL